MDSFDNHTSPTYKTFHINAFTHSRLVRYKTGNDAGDPATGEVEGDLAESIEQSDETTIIFKLRQGLPWGPSSPD